MRIGCFPAKSTMMSERSQIPRPTDSDGNAMPMVRQPFGDSGWRFFPAAARGCDRVTGNDLNG